MVYPFNYPACLWNNDADAMNVRVIDTDFITEC